MLHSDNANPWECIWPHAHPTKSADRQVLASFLKEVTHFLLQPLNDVTVTGLAGTRTAAADQLLLAADGSWSCYCRCRGCTLGCIAGSSTNAPLQRPSTCSHTIRTNHEHRGLQCVCCSNLFESESCFRKLCSGYATYEHMQLLPCAAACRQHVTGSMERCQYMLHACLVSYAVERQT